MRILSNLRHEVETNILGSEIRSVEIIFLLGSIFMRKYIEICNFFVKNEQKYKGRIDLEGSGSLRRD